MQDMTQTATTRESSIAPEKPNAVDRAVRAGMYGAEFTKGRRAAKAGKSRFDCPYNGPDLRVGWYAGFDSVPAEARATHFD